MGEKTAIAWCHHTFNPWWGCVEAGPECDNCYARMWAHRLGLELWGKDVPRRFFGDKHWSEPEKWNRAAERAGERRRVFCASQADVLEDRRDLDEHRARLWALIERTPWLDWLLLTKRPRGFGVDGLVPRSWHAGGWPRNVWAGTTCGTPAGLARVYTLVRAAAQAPVRFVSAEPLLAPVDFSPVLWPSHWRWDGRYRTPEQARAAGAYAERHPQGLVAGGARFVDWVIVGGESGPAARPMHPDWPAAVRDQCRASGTAFFFKQRGAWLPKSWDSPEKWGSRWPSRRAPRWGLLNAAGEYFDQTAPWNGRTLDDSETREEVVMHVGGHGADPAEWPSALRIQEFPTRRTEQVLGAQPWRRTELLEDQP